MASTNCAIDIRDQEPEESPETQENGRADSEKLPTGSSWSSLTSYFTNQYKAIYKLLGRHALTRATRAVPRTIGFIHKSISRGEVAEGLARPALTVSLAAQIAMDEALLAMAMTPSRFPVRADYLRVSTELAEARSMFNREGWLANPSSYHRTPPPLAPDDVTTSRGWANRINYERLSWDSGFTPRDGEPGGDRWRSFEPNRTAAATIVRHSGPNRPWVVAIHGFCMGFPFMDFQGLHVSKLHNELGVNVALPVLPLHGSRRVTRISGEPFMSFELMNAVHGLTQSIWDIRRLISWIRSQGAESIAIYGVSLGGYVASLLPAFDDDFSCVVSGIPVSDFPTLFHYHSPHHLRARALEHNIMKGPAEEVYKVVSPFSFIPRIPRDRRFIFAGYGDRLATPVQAQNLWEHWDRPEISWYPGNHIAYLWSRQVSSFLCDSMTASGISFTPEQ
ncbi:MAG TPA: prolyl oligopeptidase family serine peptidase [Acidimicrobiales bacterium]|nr:prolyl oligopeptidase family serine peptidase [Acidimicrobiales bacterium]